MAKISYFKTPQRIIFGVEAVKTLSQEIHRLGAKSPLIITDPGVVQTLPLEKVREVLEAAKIEYSLYSEVIPEPPAASVRPCVEFAQSEKADVLIGLGGGSSMDTAKMTSVMLKNEGKAADYFGVDLLKNPGIPKILLPTTAGTGSEVTSIAILTDEKERLKKAVVSDFLFADTAIIDPVLTLSLPPDITAATGMDALIHSIECFTSTRATVLTDTLALKSMEILAQNIQAAYSNGSDVEVRTRMSEGVLISAISFGNAGVGAVHALSYPLGGRHKVPHGVANALLLPWVMEYNYPGEVEKFARIAQILGAKTEGLTLEEAARAGIQEVHRLLAELNLPQRLRDLGVLETDLAEMAGVAIKNERLMANNPREMNFEAALEIYRRSY